MDMRDQILLVKNIINDEDCKRLIDEYESRKDNAHKESCMHANTGLDTVSTYSKVDLKPISYTHNLMFNKTEFMINEWVKKLEKSESFHIPLLKMYLKCSHRYRLMKYGPGGWIHPHIDGNPFIYASCTFQLNDEFEGGMFKFWNGKYQIKMERGDGLIFPAGPFWVHEVANIDSGVRYSVNSFILASSPQIYEQSEPMMVNSLRNIKTYTIN
jgi:hypothetical protein